MYCTLKKREKKERNFYNDNVIVYDVSLNRSIRVDGKPKRKSVHLFTVRHFSIENNVEDHAYRLVDWRVDKNKIQKLFPNIDIEYDDPIIEQAKQIVKDKFQAMHQTLVEENKKKEEEAQRKKEEEERRWQENWQAYEDASRYRSQLEQSIVDDLQFFLKEGYRALSKKYHPDIAKDNGASFKRIKESYDYLSQKYISSSNNV